MAFVADEVIALLKAVDQARGDVPRTVWIRRAIEQRLDKEAKAR